jgi:hypothetical protein
MEKKKFIFFILIIFEISVPFLVLAAAITPGNIPSAQELGIKQDSHIDSSDALLNVVANIVKWVYTLFFIVAVMFILFAAFNYLGGASEPEKIKKAHNMIIYAAIAIAIAFLSVGARFIVEDFLKNSSSNSSSINGGSNNINNNQNQQQLAPPWQTPQGWWPNERGDTLSI